MKLLRRLLQVQAVLWFAWSLAVGIAPKWVIMEALSQPPLVEYAWLRASAVMGVVLALLMVLVARRVEDLWWWSWAFAVLELGTATVFAINALLGIPPGAAVWPWWALTGVNGALGAGFLVGLGLAGQEKPFV